MSPPDQPRRIVIVEDDEVIINVLAESLVLEGYEVHEARDGQEGIEIIRQKRPNLIISDLTMPNTDGFELLRMLQADEQLRSIPVIVHSVMVEANYRERALQLGAKVFLNKPSTTKALLEAINSCL
jgi:CheY-like chemotaxis protein